MQEERDAELFDASVKGLQPLGIDPGIPADASGNIDAHQSKLIHRVVKHLDGGLRIRQRNGRASPDPAGIFALRARHMLVPHHRGLTALLRRQVGEINRKGAERADHAHLMAEAIHVLELPVEIEPFRPGVDRWASIMSQITVSAAAVAFRARIAAALAELLEDVSRPPVEMGIDDPHGVYSLGRLGFAFRSAPRAFSTPGKTQGVKSWNHAP